MSSLMYPPRSPGSAAAFLVAGPPGNQSVWLFEHHVSGRVGMMLADHIDYFLLLLGLGWHVWVVFIIALMQLSSLPVSL